MDREIVLLGLILLLVGPLVSVAGLVPLRASDHLAPAMRERARWDAIWAALVPVAWALAALVGWALREPDNAEPLPGWVAIATAPVALVWVRAIVRALLALALPAGDGPAVTTGFVTPRVVILPELASALDPRALEAVRQHELAHARHRDPMRIWLAQLATDLQWPWPQARSRFAGWLHSLELARDDEARRAGIDGADLADALVVAARLVARHGVPRARIVSAPKALQERVARLLTPLEDEPVAQRRPTAARSLFAAGLAICLLLGIVYGETLLRTLLLLKP